MSSNINRVQLSGRVLQVILIFGLQLTSAVIKTVYLMGIKTLHYFKITASCKFVCYKDMTKSKNKTQFHKAGLPPKCRQPQSQLDLLLWGHFGFGPRGTGIGTRACSCVNIIMKVLE